MSPAKTEMLLIVGGLVGLVMLGKYVTDNLDNVVEAVPGAIADTAAAAVIGTGEVLGIPKTDQTECEKAIAEGRTWDASFACPAGTFLKSLF